ncbi:MAG: carboxypeptidase M32 [Clostridiales bacterium]|nr:carboxypeptidase M32 [Clostridiales bacterium]
MQETIAKFKEQLAKMKAYAHALAILSYDSETTMPKAGNAALGATMGFLSGEHYSLVTAPELREMLETLAQNREELDPVTRREVEYLQEELAKMERIPKAEYVEFNILLQTASQVWREAKNKNDYPAFAPYLAKIIDFSRRFAGYMNPALPVYDAWLNEFEKGMTMATLDAYFADVRAKLVPVIHAIAERGRKIDKSCVEVEFPVWKQRKLSDYLMDLLTIDRDCCAIGETEHPFSTGSSKHDIRMTTHYYPTLMLSSFFSVIHEGGHSLYELHTGDELIGSPLAEGVSMGVHESQSRFFENLIGRSRAFIELIYPKLCEIFPEQMAGVTSEMLYLAANHSSPSLIRVEADELTYSLHIMVRYEIEKRLMDGTLTVDELPNAWNALYKEYLGIDVPDDTRGVLQDIHWSMGSFGYFPSYSIGSAYASQIYARMAQELDIDACVRAGNLKPVCEWLEEKIWKYGKMKTPGEIVENACGAPFDPKYYTDYLTGKYSALYGL